MSDIRVVGYTATPSNTADGGFISPRARRDGTLVTVDLMHALSEDGRVYAANMGTVTTPITFLVTAANRPDAWIRVPSSTTALPALVVVTLEDMTGTNTEIDVRIAQNDIGNGTSSAADVGPRTLRTDAIRTSNCVARQLATADTTAETNPLTVFRRSHSLAEGTTDPVVVGLFEGIDRPHMGYPVLVGAATWEVFVAATTTQAVGFVVMTWAEVASNTIV